MFKCRIFRYLFFSAFFVLVFSLVAFAADDETVATVNGAPVVATLNGQPYFSLESALSNSVSGDYVVLVSDASLSRRVIIPSGVHFLVPSGVTLYSDYQITSEGFVDLRGSLVRTSNSPSGVFFVDIRSGTVNVYGSLISSSSFGTALGIYSWADDVLVNIFGGRFIGFENSIFNNSSSSIINVFSGVFIPSFVPSSNIVLAHGSSFVEPGVVSWGPIYQIGQLVTSAVSWISLFCAAIVANKLLLIWLIVVFVGVSVGLIKRIVRS